VARRKKLSNVRLTELVGLVVVFLARHGGRLVWRCRAGLMPAWWCVAFLVAGWVGSWWPLYWPVPISAGLVVASVLWFAGERLSPHAQRMWLWLVPDGLDDGKAGVLDRVFARLQQEQILAIRIEHVCLDSTTVKVHPDGTGALKKTVRKPSGARAGAAPPRFIWRPQMTGVP